jgi:hypothetical protein
MKKKNLCSYRVWDNGDTTDCATATVKNGRCKEHLYLPNYQNDWVDVNVTWLEFMVGATLNLASLRKPGVLIEVQDEDYDGNKLPIKRYLIGDINRVAGVCDDCSAFEDKAIILRAKIMVIESDLKKAKDGT